MTHISQLKRWICTLVFKGTVPWDGIFSADGTALNQPQMHHDMGNTPKGIYIIGLNIFQCVNISFPIYIFLYWQGKRGGVYVWKCLPKLSWTEPTDKVALYTSSQTLDRVCSAVLACLKKPSNMIQIFLPSLEASTFLFRR